MKRYDNAELIVASPSEQRQIFQVGPTEGSLIELAGGEQLAGIRVGDTGVLTYAPGRTSSYSFVQTGRNPSVPLHCPRCHVPLTPGVALYHQPIGMTENSGPRAPYQPEAAAANSVSCSKCSKCGYSEQITTISG